MVTGQPASQVRTTHTHTQHTCAHTHTHPIFHTLTRNKHYTRVHVQVGSWGGGVFRTHSVNFFSWLLQIPPQIKLVDTPPPKETRLCYGCPFPAGTGLCTGGCHRQCRVCGFMLNFNTKYGITCLELGHIFIHVCWQ